MIAVTDDDTSIGRRRTLASDQRRRLGLRALIGSGDRIGLFVLPIAVIGLVLNIAFPAAFAVGGPPRWLQVTSAVLVSSGSTCCLPVAGSWDLSCPRRRSGQSQRP